MRRRRRCPSGKIIYTTRKKALKALDQIESLRHRANGLMDYRQEQSCYECRLCGQWHLTSRPAPPEREAA